MGVEQAASEPQGERRQVTIMFTDLVGFTPLTERLDEEVVFALIKRLAGEQTAIINRHGGMLQDFAGDGLMAFFGAPQALEDAPARACRAAVEIQRRMNALQSEFLAAFDCEPVLRIGLHTGAVVLGRIGEDKALAYNALGDAINLASRVQSAAEPGTVYCTEIVANLAAGYAEFSDLGARALKGKSEPARLFRIDGLRSAVSRFEAKRALGLGSLLGRESELARLRSLWTRSKTEGAAITLIVAEAGLGKSRLLHEFESELKDATVWRASCRPDAASAPFSPFADVLRAAFGIPETALAAEIEASIASGLRGAGHSLLAATPFLVNILGAKRLQIGAIQASELSGVRTREALVALFEFLSHVEPQLLLIFEDLHWADSASLEALHEIMCAAGRMRAMFALTTRPEPQVQHLVQAKGVEIFNLAPLEDAQAMRLVTDRLGAEVSPDLLKSIVSRAEGNPLFAEELAAYVAQRKPGAAAQPEDIPANLENLIMNRVQRMPGEDRFAVQTASVVGRQFRTALVGEVCAAPAPPVREMSRAEGEGLILPLSPDTDADREYAFKHSLIQDALYGSLLKSQRVELHGRTAEALERRAGNRADDLAAILAHHYSRAASTRKAVHYLALAAKRSLEVFSLKEAVEQLDRALAFIEADPDCADEPTLAEIVVDRMLTCCWEADFAGMIRHAERWLPRIEKLGPSRALSRTLAWLGEGYLNADRFEEAEAALDRALQIGTAIGDRESIAYAKWDQLWLAELRPDGRPSETFDGTANEILATADALGDAYLETLTFYLASTRALQFGDIATTLAWANRSLALGERTHYPPARSMGHMLTSFALAVAGNGAGALASAEAASVASGGRTEQMGAAAATALALLTLGRFAEANETFTRLYEDIDKAGFRALLPAVEVPKWAAIAAIGRVREAIAGLESAIALFTKWRNSRLVGWAHLMLGDLHKIMVEMPTPPISAAFRDPILAFIFMTARARARLHYERAADIARSAATRGFLMQALMGAALPPIGRGDRSDPRLKEARIIAEALGASTAITRIDQVTQ
ncbi:ATP-binding protein [Mesorhizobium kowhaii]|uniref:ATP-binding protein n=1 Tax=Mesorhizobium kowhaii TaxID=1300272 RepID=UPI0035ED2217